MNLNFYYKYNCSDSTSPVLKGSIVRILPHHQAMFSYRSRIWFVVVTHSHFQFLAHINELVKTDKRVSKEPQASINF